MEEVQQVPTQSDVAKIRESGDGRRLMGCNQFAEQWSDAGELRISTEDAAHYLWLELSNIRELALRNG